MSSPTEYDNHRYSTLKPRHAGYYALCLLLLAVAALGLFAANTMEHAGHGITGMNNHIVWGMPHVFAIFLIVAASGALNGASMSSVFGVALYKSFARLSIVLAMSLLVGGLMVLVLDLGRPDRLIVAMTTYNFRSIFSWNVFLYVGFLVICVVYLWMLMDRGMNQHIKKVGTFAFVWRIVLTSGTGCIFGFLVGRNSLDSALMAPMFIALSLSMGIAVLSLMFVLVNSWQKRSLDEAVVQSSAKLLSWFIVAVVYFSVVHHLTNLYVAEHWTVEKMMLTGQLSLLFWGGHIIVGSIVPFVLLRSKNSVVTVKSLLIASALAIVGGVSLLYVVVIGSQSTPQRLFPGHDVLASSFGDAGFDAYSASGWEWALGMGGVAVAFLLCIILLRVLPFTPDPQTQPPSSG